ncbi:hypothetical protein JWJ90_04345 [Desulfobulbus rhabdoformis]|uniref:hypothetical protein n=1 Tax=Desulfobulbus rhabdoformis TaxID=34032 RepID=UPI00196234ED|nr:hypothetical protein [Desulfobulbus rhabdoformis]MBM9613512.1 hypothetical protein [Desulfobulbus rhabdoformis]
MSATIQELEEFITDWKATEEGNKDGFICLKEQLSAQAKGVMEFHPRPGVTYSLRGTVPGNERSLYVMVDVIEDEPRWLSVCFFGDMISDPQELGSFVPGGLLGNDAVCFDLEECSEEQLQYVAARIDEAYASAVK